MIITCIVRSFCMNSPMKGIRLRVCLCYATPETLLNCYTMTLIFDLYIIPKIRILLEIF